MILVVSVVIDTERPDAMAVYCNGRLVWPSRAWLRFAPCRGLDPNDFVPEETDETPDVVTRLCPSCPVREACEDYGRDSRSIGWWGGVLLAPPSRRLTRNRTKLTWEQVTEIRQRHAEGTPRLQLARQYGVNHCTISGIVTGTCRTQQPRPGTMRAAARKLPLDDVAEMRQRHAAGGVSISALAREYGVNPSYASKIVRGVVLR